MSQDAVLKEGSTTKTTATASLSVKLELSDVSDGRSKKTIHITYQEGSKPKQSETVSPKRGSNTPQALAQHVQDWLMQKCKVDFVSAKKLAWAVARDLATS